MSEGKGFLEVVGELIELLPLGFREYMVDLFVIAWFMWKLIFAFSFFVFPGLFVVAVIIAACYYGSH